MDEDNRTRSKPGMAARQPLSGISAIRKGAAVVEVLAKTIREYKATPPTELGQLLYRTEWFLSQRQGNPLLSQLLYRPSYHPGTIRGRNKG